MAINFSTGQEITGNSTNIAPDGHIIQVVEYVHTSRLQTSNTSAQNFFSSSITLQDSSHGVAWYYNCAQRCDRGDGPWSLGYHDMYRGDYGSGTRMFYSGYNGFTSDNIINFSKFGVDYPGVTNPGYYVRVWAYPGANVQFNSPNNQGNDGRAVLRLMEIKPL